MESRKGARTRRAILDAVVSCYYKNGYARTTLEKIAAESGLSMGALTYHFPSITAIIQATIDFVYEERLAKHTRLIRTSLTDSQDFETALEIYWTETVDPTFVACLELGLAARTDTALYNVWEPAHAHFREQWRSRLLELHPKWEGNDQVFSFAVEYSTHLFEGMAINTLLTRDQPTELQRAIRDYLKDHLETLQKLSQSGATIDSILRSGRRRRARLKST